MRQFSTSIDIAAPPARVWHVVSDVERWPEWTTSMSSVQLVSGGGLADGARAIVKQPRLAKAEFTVTQLLPGESFTWAMRAPGVRATAQHLIAPTAAGSRLTLALEYDGPLGGVIAFLYRGLTERYMKLEAEGMKRAAETRAAA